jgi:hypothetical protein
VLKPRGILSVIDHKFDNDKVLSVIGRAARNLTTVLDWIKIDPEYLKPANLLLIILIIVTVIVGVFTLIIYFLQRYKIPILEFDKVLRNDSFPSPRYCLRVSRKKGEGRIEGCEGFLTIENKLETKALWYPQNKPKVDITKYEDLLLFTLENNKDKVQSIIFTSLGKTDTMLPDKFPLKEFMDEKLTIEIEATRGRKSKKNYAKTIKDIIEEGNRNVQS